MIEAHSAFFSMSPIDAFWTLRILPRIGSKRLELGVAASFAVPSAESPSTMNSSVRSTSLLRQSTSLAGSDDDSRAFLRRCASRCCRAATRVREAPTDLLQDLREPAPWSLAWSRSGMLVELSPFHDLGHESRRRQACRAPPWSGPRTAARPAVR